MGCDVYTKKKIIKIQTNPILKKTNEKITYSKENMINKIFINNWLRILNFFQYQDLKEIGKTNRFFNRLSKDNRILIKFFKKRNSENDFEVQSTKFSINNEDSSLIQNIIDGFI
jgi:hypothetical protein